MNWTSTSREDWQQRLQQAGSIRLGNLLRAHEVPARLAEAVMQEQGVPDKPIAQLKKHDQNAIISALVDYRLQLTGHEGFAKVDTSL